VCGSLNLRLVENEPRELGWETLVCRRATYAIIIIIIIIIKAKIIVTLYIKNVTGALYTVNYNENTLSVSVSVNAGTASS